MSATADCLFAPLRFNVTRSRPSVPSRSKGRAVTGEHDGRWEAWMVAAQAGDARAYDMLLRDCLPLLRAIARLCCDHPRFPSSVMLARHGASLAS